MFSQWKYIAIDVAELFELRYVKFNKGDILWKGGSAKFAESKNATLSNQNQK